MMKANPEKAMNERVTNPNSVNHGAVHGTMAEQVPPASRSGNRSISQWYAAITSADGGHRDGIEPDGAVAAERGDAEDDGQRVHRDPLVPAQRARDVVGDLGEVEAPERRHQRHQPGERQRRPGERLDDLRRQRHPMAEEDGRGEHHAPRRAASARIAKKSGRRRPTRSDQYGCGRDGSHRVGNVPVDVTVPRSPGHERVAGGPSRRGGRGRRPLVPRRPLGPGRLRGRPHPGRGVRRPRP